MTWLTENYDFSGKTALLVSPQTQLLAEVSEALIAQGSRVVIGTWGPAMGGFPLHEQVEFVDISDRGEALGDAVGQLNLLLLDTVADRGSPIESWLGAIENDVRTHITQRYDLIRRLTWLLAASSGVVVNTVGRVPAEYRSDTLDSMILTGVVGMGRALTCELGPKGVRTNTVSYVCPSGSEASKSEAGADQVEFFDVCSAVIFLGSPAASAISGVHLSLVQQQPTRSITNQ